MDVELPRPTTVSATFRAAARVIASNGHYQGGDYVPDPFDREMCVPHFLRPMSIVAALKTAVTGDPHVDTALANKAIEVLALRLEVGGEMGPYYGDILSLEEHIAAWGDVPGRTAESVVAVLYAAADAVEVTA
ncbi:hypothetical protein [Streptomyces sp. 35G-GA-8]|uniref:DUF6197 family protein n=1 Tax=Streptomyces sp. 35G-GA-8 TaxID=2939434 RepID=UPI00201EC0F8|nr:hypothetical protein [Streptomyces sp. 35G-GA-8]MCL7377420.1 hypothetical protein [Streptomyces sp. 35G-GA-8]